MNNKFDAHTSNTRIEKLREGIININAPYRKRFRHHVDDSTYLAVHYNDASYATPLYSTNYDQITHQSVYSLRIRPQLTKFDATGTRFKRKTVPATSRFLPSSRA